MNSQPHYTLRRPQVGETVRTYNCDEAGHYVEEYKVISISDESISMEHLRTRRYSGVTEGFGRVTQEGKDTIDYLSVPTDIKWQQHWQSSAALNAAMIKGGSMKEWIPAAEQLVVPNPP